MAGLQVGQLASRDQRFCPYAAVAKWPYKHLYGEVKRVVADNYFATGLFKTHGWHIFYIRTLLDTTDKPLLLIPLEEVQQLRRKIKDEIDVHIDLPGVTEEPGFQLDFSEEGSPRPRFLGELTEDVEVAALEVMIPAEGSAAEEREDLDERSFPMFRRHMQHALEATKQKSKAVKDKRRLDRVTMKKKRCAELKRTQCYLGLRRRGTNTEGSFNTGPNTSWEKSQQAREKYEVAAGIKIPALDTSAPAPCSFDRDPVFVCVDIEVWEMDHRKLTEIGICTLDTRDLRGLSPGDKGGEWIKQLRSRHFRVLENAHLNNVEFVAGCADRFEFGQSEWISIRDAPYVLASCFKAPFSEPGKHKPYPTDHREGSVLASKPRQVDQDPRAEKRNIILVGHDIGSDIGFMRSAGYDVGNLANLIEAVDTTVLFRAYKHEQNPRNLGAVLLDLGMTGWNLHNAGNDATYTLQVLLGISIVSLVPENVQPAEAPPEELESAEAAARERIREDYEEWALAEADGGDGGDPVAVLPWSEAQQKAIWDKGMKTAEKAEKKRDDKFARDNARSRGRRGRGGGFRGGRGDTRHTGDGKAVKDNVPTSRTFDMDAMDEAMIGSAGEAPTAPHAADSGLKSGAAWQTAMPLGTSKPAPVSFNSSGAAGQHAKPSGYLPPHLRHLRSKKEPGDGKGAAVSDKMSARLKMLDTDS